MRAISALFSSGTDSTSLGLLGGNLKELDGIYKLEANTIRGKASIGPNEIMIGKDFAEKFGLEPGDTMSIKFQDNQTGTFTVTGVFDSGSSQFNLRQAFLSSSVPQNVLGWSNNQYSFVSAQLNQPYDSKTVAANWSSDFRKPEPGKSHYEYGVFNMGPCPLPGKSNCSTRLPLAGRSGTASHSGCLL